MKANPGDIDARSDCLYGAWLCGAVLGAVGMALHHKLCHTLGGTWNLPHAETHTVVLPHAAQYNAAAAPEAMGRVARALGVTDAARGLYDLANSLGAPVALKADRHARRRSRSRCGARDDVAVLEPAADRARGDPRAAGSRVPRHPAGLIPAPLITARPKEETMTKKTMTMQDRRRVLKALGAAGALGLAGRAAPAFAQAGRPIKIGYVSPQTGPLAAFGEADKFVLGGIQQAFKGGLTIAGQEPSGRRSSSRTASRTRTARARSPPT